MGIAMMGVMHLYFNYTQPLFIQSLMTLKNVYDAKLVQIYVVGKEAKDDFQRPFKTASIFGGKKHPGVSFVLPAKLCDYSGHGSENRCCFHRRGGEAAWEER